MRPVAGKYSIHNQKFQRQPRKVLALWALQTNLEFLPLPCPSTRQPAKLEFRHCWFSKANHYKVGSGVILSLPEQWARSGRSIIGMSKPAALSGAVGARNYVRSSAHISWQELKSRIYLSKALATDLSHHTAARWSPVQIKLGHL